MHVNITQLIGDANTILPTRFINGYAVHRNFGGSLTELPSYERNFAALPPSPLPDLPPPPPPPLLHKRGKYQFVLSQHWILDSKILTVFRELSTSSDALGTLRSSRYSRDSHSLWRFLHSLRCSRGSPFLVHT